MSQPHHQTNLHLHYDLPYPSPGATPEDGSFFTLSPDTPGQFIPKDPSVHKPLTARQVFQKRLHWVTLGGQYDWTNRVYPDAPPPAFPPDIAGFLERLFPQTLAQAAIVNFYSPGDTMMMHRDVSEETNKGLVSVSLGCDGLFMIAPSSTGQPGEDGGSAPLRLEDAGENKGYVLLRLRSGDAIYMCEESRYAWHGVPKILEATCPDYLEDWPASQGRFEEWRGWMKRKRVNLNVRQMRD
jgi:DNA alkylation damage repair protein AlkB